LTYYVRIMQKEDVAPVNDIDREAFPTQWPPPDYKRELQNPLARLIVACDDNKTAGEAESHQNRKPSGLASALRRLLVPWRFSGDKSPQSARQYIVGFAGIWVMADESHITNIAVRGRYQRQGIGELLLNSIIDLSAQMKANVVTLEVRVSNKAAQRLYQKYGFIEVGVRPGYYTDNREDALLMSTGNITSAPFQAQLQQLKRAHARKYGATMAKLPLGISAV
jgi:ribosomal-protein-alanine N-acetyltransferase